MALTRLRTGGIAANAIVAASIAPGAVDITDVADGAITTNKLAANAVTSAKIAPSITLANVTITGGNVSANTIVTGILPGARLPAGSVLQVVSTTKTDTFSQLLNTTDPLTISNDAMSVSITPTSSSSKILILCDLVVSLSENNRIFAFLYKSSSVLSGATGDSAGARTRVTTMGVQDNNNFGAVPMSFSYLDSPSTTSSTSYSIRLAHGSTSNNTVYLNRSTTDSDIVQRGRSISTITVMEIAG